MVEFVSSLQVSSNLKGKTQRCSHFGWHSLNRLCQQDFAFHAGTSLCSFVGENMRIDETCVEAGNISPVESPWEETRSPSALDDQKQRCQGVTGPFLWKTCVQWTHSWVSVVALHLGGEAKLGVLRISRVPSWKLSRDAEIASEVAVQQKMPTLLVE